MSVRPKPVSEQYFGQPIGNGQDPDEPYDSSQGTISKDGYKIGGRGSRGGGSKMTPQIARKGGINAKKGSYPKNSQKIR